MIITVHVNMTRENAFEVATNVCEQLNNLNVRVLMPAELSEYFCQDYISFLDATDCVRDCDILISIGGDGTIIHSAFDAVNFDKPILGINAGRLGFLAGLEKEELELLENLITGNYTIDNRMRLSVKYFEGDKLKGEYTCLNDVVIARGTALKLCEIEARNKSKLIFDYLADGLIVATPTGSTAYSLSSGGPVVDTGIESLILTPICNHSLFSRSMIFKPDAEIELSIKNHDNCLPVFSCDGEPGIPMQVNSRIVISRAERYTKIIRIKSDSFSDILSHKLIERYGQI